MQACDSLIGNVGGKHRSTAKVFLNLNFNFSHYTVYACFLVWSHHGDCEKTKENERRTLLCWEKRAQLFVFSFPDDIVGAVGECMIFKVEYWVSLAGEILPHIHTKLKLSSGSNTTQRFVGDQSCLLLELTQSLDARYWFSSTRSPHVHQTSQSLLCFTRLWQPWLKGISPQNTCVWFKVQMNYV